MFLKSLQITNDGKLIRQVAFSKGLNLIVDESQTSSKKESGNNVGKTTVLKLIDFCLGGDAKTLFRDMEFSSERNTQVEDFLTQNNIVVTMILKEDLDKTSAKETVIKRNFSTAKNRIQEIDGEHYKEKEFQQKLKEIIFSSEGIKPSFREILSKNIRYQEHRLSHTVRVLHQTAKQDAYEAVYLFWLGIAQDSPEKKQHLLAQKKVEELFQKKLNQENSYSLVEQSLLVVNGLIKELETKQGFYNLQEDYEEDIARINQIKLEISQLSTAVSRLQLRRELIIENKKSLEVESAEIDTENVKKLYHEAKSLVPNLQKSFEETLAFHNTMIQKKIKYITEELPELEDTLGDMRERIRLLSQDEQQITQKMEKIFSRGELESILVELNKTYERKGTLEELKRMWESSLAKIDEIDLELERINGEIDSNSQLINERIAEFNKYFSQISHQLYGEHFVLSYEKNKKGYELKIGSAEGLGTGKKKGQIAAFDFAYIKFADSLGIKCPHFILHDQIENIHDNQISVILLDVVSNINCQYIIPVLRDKLPSDINIDAYKVLSLSETDKLFKLP